MARFFLNKKFLAAMVFVVFLLAVMINTSGERDQITPVEKLIKDTLFPFQRGIMKVSQSTTNFFDSILSFRQIKLRNDELEEKLAALEDEVTKLREYQFENMRLRELLEFKESVKGQLKMVPTEVVGRDLSNWLKTVTINKGLKHGIQKDMAVVNQMGLVGRVISVSNFSSEVLLITDSRSAVGGLVQLTRTTGVVEGLVDDSNLIKMIHLPRDAAIKKNQTVITSGLGGLFPRGLKIGRVYQVEFEPDGLLKYALIWPEVDFNHLEELYIVTGSTTPDSFNPEGGQ